MYYCCLGNVTDRILVLNIIISETLQTGPRLTT